MSAPLLTWHRDDEPGEWYATNSAGETVVYARRRRASGYYWGTWQTSGLFPRHQRHWTRLSEIKDAAEQLYAQKMEA